MAALLAAAPLVIGLTAWLGGSMAHDAAELKRANAAVFDVQRLEQATRVVELVACERSNNGLGASAEQWREALDGHQAAAAAVRSSAPAHAAALGATNEAVARIVELRAELLVAEPPAEIERIVAEIGAQADKATGALQTIRAGPLASADRIRGDVADRSRLLLGLVIGAALAAVGLGLIALSYRRLLKARERAEHSLRESESRFRQLAEALDQVVWITTATKDKYLYVGPAFEKIWGLPRDTLLTDPAAFGKTVYPEDREKVQRAVADQLRGETVDVEYRIRRPDGDVRWIRTRAAPIRDDRGRMMLIGGLAEDVTDRRLAEAALRISEERFRKAIDSFPYTFVIYDAERRLQFVNARAVALGGLPEKELLGKRDEEVYPRDLVDCYLPALLRAARTGEPQTMECSVVYPSGRTVFTVDYIPLRDQHGAVQEILGVTHEITERVRAEEALRESEERFKAFMDNSPTVAFLKGADGRYVYVNKVLAETFLHQTAEWLGRNDVEIWPPDQARQYRSNDLKVLAADEPQHYIETTTTPEGETHYWLMFKFPITDGAGRRFVGGVGVDITDQRLAEERMRWLNRELDHRVRNNLAVIASLAEQTAARSSNLQDFRAAFLGRVQAMGRVHALIAEGRWRQAPLRQIVADCLAPYADSTRLTASGDDVTLMARQASGIGMVLNELATNAAKHGAWSVAAGRVAIRWWLEDEAGVRRLELRWDESGGPAVREPEGEGFGSELIRQVVAFDLGGAVLIEYLADGLRCSISVALDGQADDRTAGAAHTRIGNH